jgi:probable selenium-dependent hydroxylase accessory protein YqeC
MDLREAFEPAGVVSVVGAGGKKSTLYALAAELDRAVVTATVRIPPFEDRVERLAVTSDPARTARTNDAWPLGLVAGRDGDRNRYLGYDPGEIDALASAVDVPILVKADGARTRWLKAPDDREPQLPTATELAIPIASARVVGKPLDPEFVHRPERVASLTGLAVGDRIGTADVVAVLSDERGGLKAVPDGARVVALVNMVDDGELAETAREIAEGLVADPRIDRAVLGRMDRGEVVDVLD